MRPYPLLQGFIEMSDEHTSEGKSIFNVCPVHGYVEEPFIIESARFCPQCLVDQLRALHVEELKMQRGEFIDLTKHSL